MKISRKVEVIVLVAVALSLVITLCPFAIAVEPYGPAQQGALKIGIPDGKTLQGGGSSSGWGTSQDGEASRDNAVKPGVKILISGGGFAPFAKYDILWNGKVLIDPYADEKGFAWYEFTIPANADTGIHTVSMRGEAATGGVLTLSSNVFVKAKKVTRTVKSGSENGVPLPAEDVEGQKSDTTTVEGGAQESGENEIAEPEEVSKTLKRGAEKAGEGAKSKGFPFAGNSLLLYALIACIVIALAGFGVKFLLKAH